jgi:lipoprotein-anchoring transpeptidase ErfK/SrfK
VKGEAASHPGAPPPSEPSPRGNAKVFLAQAERAWAEGSLLEAKRLYQQALQEDPTSTVAAAVQQRLGEVNLKLFFSPTITPESFVYVISPGDTLSRIAKKFHTTVEMLRAANSLTSDRIRPAQRLKVMKASFSLIVDKSQSTLILKNGEEVLKVYPCSTGKEGLTPTGTFKVVNRIVDPPWFTAEGVIPPGDPRNILGSRWLGFDLPGYGIHGTTDPASIGKAVTQGCVRLANVEAEELFTLLPEGTEVTIVE